MSQQTVRTASAPSSQSPTAAGHQECAVACILQNPDRSIDLVCIPRLRPTDRTSLKQEWKRREGGCTRLRLAFSMAWVADDEISRLLIEAFRTIGGRAPAVMDSEEVSCMATFTLAMGICAGRSERMSNYLRRCTEPDFILREKKWRAESAGMEAGVAMVLAASCTKALGASGQTGAAALLRQIRANGACIYANSNQSFSNPINREATEGVFWLYLARNYGSDAILRDIVLEADHARFKKEWLETLEGRDWHDWSKKLDEERLHPMGPVPN